MRAKRLMRCGTAIIGIAFLAIACARTPRTAEQFFDRGVILLEQGEWEPAISDFTEAIRLDPNLANVYYNRGIAYTNMGDVDRAIADYTQAIRLNPNLAMAYNNRG